MLCLVLLLVFHLFWPDQLLIRFFVFNYCLNQFLYLADIGIITTPAHSIDKSGSAIAWQDRNIPIFISGMDESYDYELMQNKGIYKIHNSEDIIAALANSSKVKFADRLSNVVNVYSNELN